MLLLNARNLFIPAIAGLVLAMCCSSAPAAIIASYQFNSGNAAGSAATTADANLIASVFADGDGGTSYSSTIGNPVPSIEKAYLQIALGSNYLNSNSYFEFTLSAKSGFKLDLSGVSFDYDKNQLSGTGTRPTITFDLRSSLDNYAFTLGTVNDPGNGATGTFQTSINSLATAANDVTFRIYVAKDLTTYPAGLVHLDNVNVQGSVEGSATNLEERVALLNPEPASLIIWGGVGAAGLIVAWRRKRAKVAHPVGT